MKVKTGLFFFLILFFSFLSVFWKIYVLPPATVQTSLPDRLVSSAAAFISVILIFFWSSKILGHQKNALLTSLLYILQPWTIQEARVYSVYMIFLCVLILATLLIFITRSIFIKLLFTFTVLAGFLLMVNLIYKVSFTALFKNFSILLPNVFKLLSFEFIFFDNQSFWWGTVREQGMLLPVFIPFLLIGTSYIVRIAKLTQIILGVWFIIVLVISAASPTFPEGRFFFLNLPVFLLLIVSAIIGIFKIPKVLPLALFVLIVVYMLHFFQHYYFSHFPATAVHQLESIYGKY